jgi:hypothetical protein
MQVVSTGFEVRAYPADPPKKTFVTHRVLCLGFVKAQLPATVTPDRGARLVVLIFPGCDLPLQSWLVRDARVETLLAQHTQLDLDHAVAAEENCPACQLPAWKSHAPVYRR